MPERDLLHIAYAPAAYYRPWQATYARLRPAQQRWLNARVIREQALPAPDVLSTPDCALARRLIRQWPHLPQVALLMAAARLRRWVLAERASLALPASVHVFMRMGHAELLGERPLPIGTAADPQALTGWGAGCLQAVAPQLPAWLGARLSLPFVGLDLPESTSADVGPPAIDLLWSALRHAETLS